MWSTCDRSCGKGIQSRTRLITQHPSPGGKRCPALSQKRACLGNRCSAKYKKYKSPIVGKCRELHLIGIYFTTQLFYYSTQYPIKTTYPINHILKLHHQNEHENVTLKYHVKR